MSGEGSWWMRWEDLLFLHWEVEAGKVQALLPPGLEAETFAGRAWVGVVPFRMRIRPRAVPLPAPLGNFPECNVRTYVAYAGVPGVWFFSLDVPNALAVVVARWRFHLPYHLARMRVHRDGPWVVYAARRWTSGRLAPSLRVRYRASGAPRPSPPGSLEHFLTERYRLYSVDRRGRIYEARIAHEPWRLAPAEVALEENTLLEPLGLRPESPCLAHFASPVVVQAWPLAPASSDRPR